MSCFFYLFLFSEIKRLFTLSDISYLLCVLVIGVHSWTSLCSEERTMQGARMPSGSSQLRFLLLQCRPSLPTIFPLPRSKEGIQVMTSVSFSQLPEDTMLAFLHDCFRKFWFGDDRYKMYAVSFLPSCKVNHHFLRRSPQHPVRFIS